jgi:hypothetical protein
MLRHITAGLLALLGFMLGTFPLGVLQPLTAASRVSGRVWSLVRITVPNGLKSVRIGVENRKFIE